MKFTYYTIIGRDLNLLKGHVHNIKYHAGFDRLTCDKEFVIIVYKNRTIPEHVTESILTFCRENDITAHVYNEPEKLPFQTNHDYFIHNLYACWNLGYQKSTGDIIFRGGSDQVFSSNSFINLYDAYMTQSKIDENFTLQANTVENFNMIRQIGADSRHLLQNFGNNFNEMNYAAFDQYVTHLNKNVKSTVVDIHQALKLWERPKDFNTSLGVTRRCDGCSWLMTRNDYNKFGPIPVFERGHTGDVVIHDKMQEAGYKDYIVPGCVTYHFVRGESKDAYTG